MKRQMLIIFVILLFLIAFIGYRIYNYRIQNQKVQNANKEYEQYEQKELLGTKLASIINKVIDQNEKNAIDKNEKGIYMENDTNSLKIEISFLETDKNITMEAIASQGIESFIKNFGSFRFKCTKIEYHAKTNLVKKLTFEQVKF